MQLEALLSDLGSVPDLHGGECIGRWDIFDWQPASEHEHIALALCADCPVLTHCRRWLASLPEDAQPSGVVAGQVIRPHWR